MSKIIGYPDSIGKIIHEIDWSSKAQEYVLRGDEFIQNNARDEARKAYETALTIQQDNYNAFAGLEYIEHLEKPVDKRFLWGGNDVSYTDSGKREENAFLNRKEFENRKRRLASLPRMMMLELTTKCNFSCFHCSRTYFPLKKMDLDQKVLSNLIEMVLPNMTWVTVTGFGEQTISHLYHYLMSYLVDLNVTIHFSTNTSTLSAAHIDALVKHDANVILSIDGTSRQTFETIRHGGDWQNLIRTLFLIKRIRSIRHSNSLFRITFVMMRMNIQELPDMLHLINFFHLDDLTVQDYLPCGGPEADKQTLRLDPKRGNRYMDAATELAKSLNIKVLMPKHFETNTLFDTTGIWNRIRRTRRLLPQKNRIPMRCFQPWQNPSIRSDGSVTPCCNSIRSMGSMHKTSFFEIWNGWRFRLFRFMVDTWLPPPECRLCNVIDGINAGNPGNTIAREGLLIKALYYIERKVLQCIQRFTKT